MCPFNFYHNSRFRKPPCNPGRSDFPSPVLVSALQAIFRIKAFLHNLRFKCRLTYTQDHTVYQYPRFEETNTFWPDLRLVELALLETTEYPEPLCPMQVLPLLGRLQ